MLNPTTLLLPPLIITLSLPLFLFASFTSLIAIFALLLRVLVVYVELGLVIIHDYFASSTAAGSTVFSSRRPSRNRTSPPASLYKAKRSQHARHASATGSLVLTANPDPVTTPGSGGGGGAGGGGAQPLTPGVRDYEGVGGWRPANPNDDLDDGWTSMNSRLELPAAPERKRRHRRSLTSGGEHFLVKQRTRLGANGGREAGGVVVSTPILKSSGTTGAGPPTSAPLGGPAGMGMGMGMGAGGYFGQQKVTQSGSGDEGG